jgi:hypothetical protein
MGLISKTDEEKLTLQSHVITHCPGKIRQMLTIQKKASPSIIPRGYSMKR